jgi:simple sugar transport system permease protein
VAAAVLVYLFFFAVAGRNGFTSVSGTASWLDTASELGIIAIPVALLMIAGEFDLSVGSMVASGSILTGIVVTHFQQPVWVAILVGVGIAFIVGIGNGLLVTRTGLPSFIVTLGANLIMAGLALTLSYTITGTTTISVNATGFWSGVLAHQFGQFDISIVWWILLAAVGAWILNKSRFGPWILATGGNTDQARQAGVLTSRVKVILYVTTALAATLVGMIQALQFSTGDAVGGQEYVFEAPIVVVIGGVLLMGGFGSIVGVLMGTIIYGTIGGGLFYTGWNTNLSQVVLGALMLIAVLTNNQLRQMALRPLSDRKRAVR